MQIKTNIRPMLVACLLAGLQLQAYGTEFFLIREKSIARIELTPFNIVDQARGIFGEITCCTTLPSGDLAVGNSEGVVYLVDRHDLGNVLEQGSFGNGSAITALAAQSNNDLVIASAGSDAGSVWIRRPYNTPDLSEQVAFVQGIPVGDIGIQSDDSIILAHSEAGYLYPRDAKLGAHPAADGFIRLYDSGGRLNIAVADSDDVFVAGGPAGAGYLWKFSPALESLAFINVENLAPFSHVAVVPGGDVVVGERDRGFLYMRDGTSLEHKSFVVLAVGLVGIVSVGDKVVAVCNAGKEADAGYLYLREVDISNGDEFRPGLGTDLIGIVK